MKYLSSLTTNISHLFFSSIIRLFKYDCSSISCDILFSSTILNLWGINNVVIVTKMDHAYYEFNRRGDVSQCK